MKVSEVSEIYKLPELRHALQLQCQASLVPSGLSGKYKLPFQWLDCWDRVRLQLRRLDSDDDATLLSPVTVMAAPPSADAPLGQCNFVLVKRPIESDILGIQGGISFCNQRDNLLHYSCAGHIVAQIRLIFQTVYEVDSGKQAAGDFFAYIEPFEPSPSFVRDGVHVPDADTGLFRVVRKREMDGSRCRLIVPLNTIWRPIDLVPVFGEKIDRKWRSVDVVEVAEEFFVNSFL